MCSLAYNYGDTEILDHLIAAMMHQLRLLRNQRQLVVKRFSPEAVASFEATTSSLDYTFEHPLFRRQRIDVLQSFEDDYRGRISAFLVYRLINEYGNCIRKSWSCVS